MTFTASTFTRNQSVQFLWTSPVPSFTSIGRKMQNVRNIFHATHKCLLLLCACTLQLIPHKSTKIQTRTAMNLLPQGGQASRKTANEPVFTKLTLAAQPFVKNSSHTERNKNQTNVLLHGTRPQTRHTT